MREKKMKYYNAGGTLGVIGVEPTHESGEYSFLPSHWARNPWIRTEDLKDTREEAEQSRVARFLPL